ncbi:aminotransferase class I/II-fold pyridoxal phosphate-dependent enzyme [Sulfurisphaera ohwakuensis]|uniref:Aminotransferase class I/II-fold pyridoxal phosphate-dependent enzyme n=1 Tax=Sulfurisphaera ohwakuensis TaxID=69656 RepID=A0A650CEF8_SULOH|nr:aminotransferase class I/II-fold pyridoxal phosphate-dependent enzyme [Sulfurisphaera ohwakuensis]MBB5252907.1 cystathionine gamma-synthase [Sulfurisphaera ohwakuensis]QGR16162.1 aminotransferase class I/II-fold pyridoxal phosphate-dependent enzyme [Sulfurisphaera ohwakuensis]
MREGTKVTTEGYDEETGAITTPIYQTTSYIYPIGEKYRYSREVNPTVLKLAEKISELEEAEMGVAFSSGMGAISSTLLTLAKPGSKILIHRDMFGRTYRFFTDFMRNLGVEVDVANPGEILEMVKVKKYDIVYVETISNPLLRVIDIPALSKICKENGSLLITDATFSTPINQKPLVQGADIVLHSASKFIAGHNDVIAGLGAGSKELMTKVDLMRRTLGTSLDPHAAYLVIRGIKTLKIRMDVINSNAQKIAEYLQEHNKIKSVYYPGLKSHPDYETARRILKGYGGVVTFEIKGSMNDALNLITKFKVILPAQTLGGVNSTISHPATMTHRTLTPEERKIIGISDSMLRLSVGIEDVNDLIEDLDKALTSLN